MLKFLRRLTYLSLILTSLTPSDVWAQNSSIKVYYIQFTDKDISPNSPSLSTKAKKRREKFGIAIDDKDYPVNGDYVHNVLADTNITLRYTLKWHNAIVVDSEVDVDYLLDKDYITKVEYVGKAPQVADKQRPIYLSPVMMVKNSDMSTTHLEPEDYGISYPQIRQIGVTELHKKDLNGEGVSIAIFDAGFKNIHTIPSFTRHQGNGLLRYGYDIAELDNELNINDNHGTSCASCFGAYDRGNYIGSSPRAHITLFRTEYAATEFPVEELNWCKAAELADSLGVDMITSSLGYNQYDDKSLSYKHSDLDGRTSYISQSAAIAVSKGITVLNSAGNEGDNKWRKIGTPADVSEVITVGAVDLEGKPGKFTSQGYNADGRVKPDIAACGVLAAVASPNGNYYKGYGTSYATPIAAGGVACLIQAFPKLTPKEIGDLVRLTATQAEQPDSFVGYGVAQFDVAYAYQMLRDQGSKETQILKVSDDQIVVFSSPNQEYSYKIYTHRKFLRLFRIKSTKQRGAVNSSNPLYRIYLKNDAIQKRSNKYTLKITYPKNVGKEPLIFSDLSIFPD